MLPILQPKCESCGDMGIVSPDVPIGHTLWGRVIPCPNPDCEAGKARNRAIYAKQFKSSGLPETYAKLSFQSWEAQIPGTAWEGKSLAYGAARVFAESGGKSFTLREAATMVGSNRAFINDARRKGLVLTGPVGVGKTGLAASIVNHLQMIGVGVLYMRTFDLIQEIQDTYDPESEITTLEKYYSVINCPVLVLDEFELQNYTEDRLEVMEKIIRGRHGKELPLVATTNIPDWKVFGKLWDQRIGDVVATYHWISLSGEKLRNTVNEVVGF